MLIYINLLNFLSLIMDFIDKKILEVLQHNSQISNQELAEKVALSYMDSPVCASSIIVKAKK
jgi:hypothetical protein